MPTKPGYPFQRFIISGANVHVAERPTTSAEEDTRGFQGVIDDAGVDWDWETALTKSRMGYLLGEGEKRQVIYVADETLRQWASDNGIALTFEAI